MKKATKDLRLKQIKNEKIVAYFVMFGSLGFLFTIILFPLTIICMILAKDKINRLNIEESELK